jgi:hypothetical protein
VRGAIVVSYPCSARSCDGSDATNPSDGVRAGWGWSGANSLSAFPTVPLRAGLRGLARYCEARGITPAMLDGEVLASFVAHDFSVRLAAAVNDQGRNLALAWKRAVAMQVEPERFNVVKAVRKREPYTLPLTAYPASFQSDVERFIQERTRFDRRASPSAANASTNRRFGVPTSGPFTKPRNGKPLPKWKPSTVRSRHFSILQAAVSLHRTGTPLEEILLLRDLVQPVENAGRILEYYDNGERLPRGGQLAQLGEVLRQISHDDPNVSDDDRSIIKGWAAEVVAPRQSEMGPKARKCLLALIQPRARSTLLHLPGELEHRAKEEERSPEERARLAGLGPEALGGGQGTA